MQIKIVALDQKEPIALQKRFTIKIDSLKQSNGDRKKRRRTSIFETAKGKHVEILIGCQKLIPFDILI